MVQPAQYAFDNRLRNLAILRNCDPASIEDIAAHFKLELFRPGQVVVLEGKGNPSLRVVQKGFVEVISQGRCARLMEEGESHGEAQLLGVQRQATETLRARTTVEMRVLTRKALVQVLARLPASERRVFQHLAICYKLEEQQELVERCQRHGRADEKPKEKLQQLEWQRSQLEQMLYQGRKFSRMQEPGAPSDILQCEANLSPMARLACKDTGQQRTRMVVEDKALPGCWQSLADWHRQLATSSEAPRLNLWQLNHYDRASPRDSARLGTLRAQCVSRASCVASRCSNRQSPTPLPPRPHSVASAAPMLQQPPYPPIPRSPLGEAGKRGSRIRARAFGQSGARGQRNNSPCTRRQGVESNVETMANTEGTHWWSVSLGDEASASLQDRFCADTALLPPGLGEAIDELSSAIMRPQLQCESLGRGASPAGGMTIEYSPYVSNSTYASVISAANPIPAIASVISAANTLGQSEFRGLMPVMPPPEPLTPPRRLEVTLRGTFRTGEPSDVVEDDEAQADPTTATRAASTTCWSEREDSLRVQMGFARDEGGLTPSGRSSVPAVHGDPFGGALSAPPFAGTVDEGIELASLVHSVEHQLVRILERSLRGPSRATSCEPPEPFGQNSPRASPAPSLCPSPSPRNVADDLSLRIFLRLCQSRCGSSSAVLELILDHSLECSEGGGCCCWPTPDDAEVRLRAYFARHSMLRLASTQPPVRVCLESLDNDDRAAG